MVIKDSKLRDKLWNLRFCEELSKKECVQRFLEAKLACQSEIYATLKEFDDKITSEYTSKRSRKERKAGGLTTEQLQQLKFVIDEDPDRMYGQIKEEMARKYHVTVTITQISEAVTTSVSKGGLGYSHKVKQFAAAEKNHLERTDFMRFIHGFLPAGHEDWDKVVFIDEMHRSLREGERRRCLGPRGVPSVQHTSFRGECSQTFTLFGALNTRGILPNTVHVDPLNCDADACFLWVSLFLCPQLGNYDAGEPNSIVVADNAVQHLDERSQEAIRATGALLLFLPAYSPEWNPIESFFFYLKHIWMRDHLHEYSGPTAVADCVKDGCESVDSKRARGYFRKSGFQVPEPLNEAEVLAVVAMVAAITR